MRLSKKRLAVAYMIGSVAVGLTAPAAWATDDAPGVTAMPSASTSDEGFTTPAAADTTAASTLGEPFAVLPTAAEPAPSANPTATSDPLKEFFDSIPWLPAELPANFHGLNNLDGLKNLHDLSDLHEQPLLIDVTCSTDGPKWTVKNTSANTLRFSWLDSDLNGDSGTIAAGETLPLHSSAGAVLAVPFDPVSGKLVMAIPAVGFCTCSDTAQHPTSSPALPVAPPAAPIPKDKIYFTG